MSKLQITRRRSSCAIEGAMSALADQVPEWKEFPKGLHVMLVDQDLDVINDLKSKLHSCGYSVTCYSRGEEALQALEDKSKIFHVVVVDATRDDTFDGFAVVAAAKHLTTIMMASTENMNIMMQGIAAGASEFLQKPLSEERLKNIWQHVVRKALGSGHLGSSTALSLSTSDLKFKATLKLNVGSGTSDSRQNAAEIKPKYEDHVACNADELDETDEMCGTQEELLFHEDIQHHIQSNFSLMDKDGKEGCDAFLCLTPPQLENSCTRIGPTDHDDNMELVGSSLMPASQEFNMKTDLKEMHDYFDDCDHYLHIKSEVDEAVNNSVILNDLFEMKSQINSDNFLVMPADDQKGIGNEEFIDAKLCAVLQLDDIPGSLDDIALAGDILDDTTDQSLSMGLDCPDDEEYQEVDDEEALLLTKMVEVHRNSKSHAASSNDRICNHDNMYHHDSTGTASCPISGSGVSEAQEDMKSRSDSDQSCSMKGSKSSNGKKKMKVDWTPELHRRFVQAVEQLGVDKAIPSRILELMGVKCLTRHNIASHLQKYRSHRRHVQAREVEAASWNKHRRTEVTTHGTRSATSAAAAAPPQPAWPAVLPATTPALQPIQPRAAAAFAAPATPALHVWGHPTLDPSLHFWPAWPPPGCQLDAWGNPFYPTQRILRIPFTPMPSVANMAWPPPAGKVPSAHPSKEIVVAAINEVLRNPYVPLPLGLKSPSLESVVGELQRQGISIASTASA